MLGSLLVPSVLKSVGNDFSNSVFSYMYRRECVLRVYGAIKVDASCRSSSNN